MSKEKQNQVTVVLNHLKKNKKKGLTSMEAFKLYGITRLAVKISSLRHRGYVIDCVLEEGNTRYGNTCRYGRYVLISEPKVDGE